MSTSSMDPLALIATIAMLVAVLLIPIERKGIQVAGAALVLISPSLFMSSFLYPYMNPVLAGAIPPLAILTIYSTGKLVNHALRPKKEALLDMVEQAHEEAKRVQRIAEPPDEAAKNVRVFLPPGKRPDEFLDELRRGGPSQ